MLRKITILAVLLALVMAMIPTSGVFASNVTAERLEKKWDQLVERYNKESFSHGFIHRQVENYLKNHKNASTSTKNNLEQHLAICNSALASIDALIATHPGFDNNGNAVDFALANESIKKLANLLQVHWGSVKNLKEHMK